MPWPSWIPRTSRRIRSRRRRDPEAGSRVDPPAGVARWRGTGRRQAASGRREHQRIGGIRLECGVRRIRGIWIELGDLPASRDPDARDPDARDPAAGPAADPAADPAAVTATTGGAAERVSAQGPWAPGIQTATPQRARSKVRRGSPQRAQPVGSCLGSIQIPLRSRSDPTSIPHRSCLNSASIPLGSHLDLTSILLGFHLDPT